MLCSPEPPPIVVSEEVQALVASLIAFLEAQTNLTNPPVEEVLPIPPLFQLSLRETKDYLPGEIRVLGEVLHFTEGKLVVKSYPATPLLDLGSSVCAEDSLLIGVVDDVLGSVEHPHYSIDAYHCLPNGSLVFYPVETAKYLQSITHKPGTDASTVQDREAAQSSDSDEEQPPQQVKKAFTILKRPPANLD